VVPTTQPIKKLYHEFSVKKRHLALVLDENGTVAGLVTMEDIVEEIMGEIQDETDTGESERILKFGENSWSASGDAELQEIDKTTGIWLGGEKNEINDEERRKSLSLLFIENFQRLPKVGKTIMINNCNLTIESVDRYKISRIRIDWLANS